MTRDADQPLSRPPVHAAGAGGVPGPGRAARGGSRGLGGRRRILRRLRYLRNWEGANVVLLPLLLLHAWEGYDPVVRLPPLLLLSAILLQGSWYWHLKIRQLRDGVALPRWFAPVYRTLRRLNTASIATLALLLFAAAARGIVGPWDLAWATGMLLFSAAEVVNYFHVQLMHDSPADVRWLLRYRRLRGAPLAEDLARSPTAYPG